MLNQLLGIKYPIIQGAMANIATAEFAAAVSEQGAMGIIATGAMTVEQARESIHKARVLTTKPFGVNVMLMHPDVDAMMEMICQEKVDLVTCGAGNPGKYIAALKESGSKIFPVVASVALAKRMERIGVDGLIVEGGESGGHVGQQTTMALVPQVCGLKSQGYRYRSNGSIAKCARTDFKKCDESPIHKRRTQWSESRSPGKTYVGWFTQSGARW